MGTGRRDAGILDRWTEGLAARTSRAGFLGAVGRLTLAAAGALVGVSGLADSAEARSIKCCNGTNCSATAGYNGINGCPAAYGGCCVTVKYTWQCGANAKFYCHDCYTLPASSACPNNPPNGGYYCTYQDTTSQYKIAC